MKIKTREDYLESLRRRKAAIYVMGERVEDATVHPNIKPHVECAALTYSLALEPEHAPLLTAESHLTGKTISRFTHIQQNCDDLAKKVEMMRLLGRLSGSCFQRCVGCDGLNALYSITFEVDRDKGTEYHARFLEYLKFVQEENIMVTGAMTDPKGDRSKRPCEQPDPDHFVRVVERNEKGIVVRGAKMHQTGAVNSHHILVMPTCAMTPDDRDYAVSFAVPSDAKGIVMILGRQTNDARRREAAPMDAGNYKYAAVGGEATIIFDDVFVPWETVFLCGETEFCGLFVERFASYHRQNYGGCKVGVADVLIGAAALAARQHGVEKVAHVRDKLAKMTRLAETLYSCSLACAMKSRPTASGAYEADPLLANVVKINVSESSYEIARLAQDLAGGVIATMPSRADFENPELKPYVEKYLKASEGADADARMRVMRLIENLSGGTGLVESMHGAGSPAAMQLMIHRRAGLEEKIALAKRLIDLEDA